MIFLRICLLHFIPFPPVFFLAILMQPLHDCMYHCKTKTFVLLLGVTTLKASRMIKEYLEHGWTCCSRLLGSFAKSPSEETCKMSHRTGPWAVSCDIFTFLNVYSTIIVIAIITGARDVFNEMNKGWFNSCINC